MNITLTQKMAMAHLKLFLTAYPHAQLRQWHLGERGWFVVDGETYERLWPKAKE